MRHRVHRFDADEFSDGNDEDVDLNHNHQLNASDDLLPPPNYNFLTFPPVVPLPPLNLFNSDTSTTDPTNLDALPPYALPDLSQLLETPLTEQERRNYTKDGVKVFIEDSRAQKWWDHGTIFFSEFKALTMLHSFNSFLKRIGSDYTEWSIRACWLIHEWPKKEYTSYLMDWADISSLYLPYNRQDFHFRLKKIKRTYNKHKLEMDTGPQPKKRKKNKTAIARQEARNDAVQYLQSNLEDEIVEYIMNRLPSSTWMRLAIFFSEKQWSLDKINQYIMSNYMKKDEEYAKAQKILQQQPNRAEATKVTNTLNVQKHRDEALKRQKLIFDRMVDDDDSSLNPKQERYLNGIDKGWLFMQYKETLKDYQAKSAEMLSMRAEIDELKKVMKSGQPTQEEQFLQEKEREEEKQELLDEIDDALNDNTTQKADEESSLFDIVV